VDFLVDFPRGYDLFAQRLPLAERLAELLKRRVELLPEHELSRHIRDQVLKEAVDLSKPWQPYAWHIPGRHCENPLDSSTRGSHSGRRALRCRPGSPIPLTTEMGIVDHQWNLKTHEPAIRHQRNDPLAADYE